MYLLVVQIAGENILDLVYIFIAYFSFKLELLGDSDGSIIEFSEIDSLGLINQREENYKTPEVSKSDSGIYLDTDDMLIDFVNPSTSFKASQNIQSSSIPKFYFPYGKQSQVITSKFKSKEFEVNVSTFFICLV